ncbi:MAG TPA: T9SS type A sorting domain-containing protein [Chitinophagales bacterium]|nr:T9SS type A sorting domain-containing protein [Chitinophagales bacterium]
MKFIINIFLIISLHALYAQVLNDDCASAIDYGVLDGRKQDFSSINTTGYDTCFQVSNIGAVANFPFYFSNSFCGQSPIDAVNGIENDVWYKISTLGNFEMFCNTFSNFSDTVKITFWADGGNGSCGSFTGGSQQLIIFNNQNWFNENYAYIPFSSHPYLYLQISGINPADTVDFYMCLRGGNFSAMPVCSVGSSSTYDSLCFVTNVSTTNPTSISSNDGNITVSVSEGLPPYHFVWSNGDTTSSLQGLSVGTYTLSITDASGCQNSHSINLTAPTSIKESPQSDFSLFPNPTKEILNLKFNNNSYANAYEMVNMLGQSITGIKQLNNNDTEQINVSAFSEGIYLLKIYGLNNVVKTERVMIHR